SVGSPCGAGVTVGTAGGGRSAPWAAGGDSAALLVSWWHSVASSAGPGLAGGGGAAPGSRSVLSSPFSALSAPDRFTARGRRIRESSSEPSSLPGDGRVSINRPGILGASSCGFPFDPRGAGSHTNYSPPDQCDTRCRAANEPRGGTHGPTKALAFSGRPVQRGG